MILKFAAHIAASWVVGLPAAQFRRSGPADDGAVHPVGIEAAGTVASVIDHVEHLREGAWDAQGVAVDVEWLDCPRGNIQGVHRRAVDVEREAESPDTARVLSFSAENCRRGRQMCAAA